MKHAYLIIAHNEFEVLSYLISALDDERNDIFIHVDKKVKTMPRISTKKAGLYIMEKRNDVRWGHYLQVRTTLDILFYAYDIRKYAVYHVISGTHLPLKSQDEIHAFFSAHPEKNFFMSMPTNEDETDLKIRRYNFFVRNFMHRNPWLRRVDQLCWQIGIKIQKILRYKRHRNLSFQKVSNWFSLSSSAISWLRDNEKIIEDRYRYTLCADEYFAISELSRSSLEDSVVYCPHLLKTDFTGVNPKVYTSADYQELKNTSYLFARKFGGSDLDIVKRIVDELKANKI